MFARSVKLTVGLLRMRIESELKNHLRWGLLLAVATVVYENLDLKYSKEVGWGGSALCLFILGQMIWTSWTILVSAVNVTFKEASAFTWWRRQVIRYDLARMHSYFSNLEMPVPTVIPPATVHEGVRGTYTPDPVYRGELQIPRPQVTDRKVVTDVYASYVMQKAFPDPSKAPGFWDSMPPSARHINQFNIAIFFCADLRRYFVASYWNSAPEEEKTGTLVLWRIRETFGHTFADKLVGKVCQIAVDSLPEIADHDVNVTLRRALKIADGVVEAYRQKWPQIQKILNDNPIEVKFVNRIGNVDPREFSPY
jgi:hypothetical protein